MTKYHLVQKNCLGFDRAFKAKLVYVAILSAFAGGGTNAATTPIKANQTFSNDAEYSFSSSEWQDGRNGFIDDTADSAIMIADDKTLTLKQEAFERREADKQNPESGITTADAIYKNNDTKLTVSGGKLDIHMYESANFPTDVDRQDIEAAGIYIWKGQIDLENSLGMLYKFSPALSEKVF